MKSSSYGRLVRSVVLPGVAVMALGLGLAGCGGNDSSSTSSASDSTSTSTSPSTATSDTGSPAPASSDGGSGASISGELDGGGSSAQTAAQAAWTAGFQGENSGATVNYDPVGSGTGRQNFISKAYAFAGSDSALSTDTSAGASEVAQAKATCGGTDAIEVPAYISPIAIIFNLNGVSDLNLDSDTIAKIFDDKITTWDDPAIKALNPDATLPSTKITPVHRSDDSGTTKNFTDYLSQTAGGSWSYPADDTWPKSGGESAEGTSGVVASVKGGDGTIGYADASQAGGLTVAAIKVGTDFNKPSAEGASQVVGESPLSKGRDATDLSIDVDRTATGKGDYPLLLTSYLIACPTYSDAGQAALVKGYLAYAVSDAGQQAAAEQAGSAPLSADLAAKAQAIVDKIAAK